MRKAILMLFVTAGLAAGAQNFENYYPYWLEGEGDVVINYTDGYAMAGFSAEGVYGSKLFIIRTDLKGDTLWTRHFDFEDTESLPYINSYTIDDDSNVYLGVKSAGARSLIKMSPEWDTIWSKQYDSFSDVNQIVFSRDKHLLLSAYGQTSHHRMYKMDLDGNIIWQSEQIHHTNEIGFTYRYSPSILEMNDNRFVLISVLSGWYGSFVSSDVYTFTMNGDSISYASFDGYILCDTYLYENALFSLYHSTGATSQFSNFLIKFLPDGTILWEKELAMAKTCYTYRFLPVSGDKLIAVGVNGYTEPIDQINGDKLNAVSSTGIYEPLDQIFLHVMTINGDSLWTAYLGNSQQIWPYDVKQCTDKGYVVTGVSEISGNYTPLLIKTDSIGNLSNVGINNDFMKSKITVYPNPATEYVIFESRNIQGGLISISDIYGSTVAKMAVTGEKTVWDARGVQPGAYLYHINNGKYIMSGKLMIIK